MGFVAIMMIYNCFLLYQFAQGNVPGKFVSSGPQGPDLPAKWYAFVVVLEAAALFLQLICGFTLYSGLVICFLHAGCGLTLHLFFYSGTLKENAMTLLPVIALSVLSWVMVLSAPFSMGGNMDISRYGEALLLLAMIPAGAIVGFVYLSLLGISRSDADSERASIYQGYKV